MWLIVSIVILVLLLAPLVLSISATMRSNRAREDVEGLLGKVSALERQLRDLRLQRARELEQTPEAAPKTSPESIATQAAPPVSEQRPAAIISPREEVAPPAAPPPPLPIASPPRPQHAAPERPIRRVAPPAPEQPAAAIFDWEQFMGGKLLAWIGGLALFLGIAFFVKYSFEHNLIPPAMRVAIGFAAGAGLVGGGIAMKRKAYAVTAQTLCATGILVLYATTFACHSFYHFPFFTLGPTFLLMALITAAAFLLAVRLDAQVVAVLGMVGGFLTPVLLSTGQDNPAGLFGYIALLDAGLLAVALHRRWHYLAPLGAFGTALMQLLWTERFFTTGRYFEGNLVLVPFAIFLGLLALFSGAVWWAKLRAQSTEILSATALALALVAFGFGFYLLSFAPLTARPVLLFGYILLVDLAVLGIVWLEPRTSLAQPVAGLLVFLSLAVWTGSAMTQELLHTGLTLYLLFAVLHTLTPLALQRWRGAEIPSGWSHAFPALALLLVLMPIFRGLDAMLPVWPFVFLMSGLAIVIATLSGALLPVFVTLVLTLVVIGGMIVTVPATLAGLPTLLTMLGFFAVFFFAASIWVARRFAEGGSRDLEPSETLAAMLLPASSAALPFLLLMQVVLQLPLANPSPVFALALLLAALLFAAARWLRAEALPLVGLLCTAGLAHALHFRHFSADHSTVSLLWYLAFHAVYLAFPFVWRAHFSRSTLPWIAGALSGPLIFPLVHRLVGSAHPEFEMGFIPAAFAVPSLLALWLLVKNASADAAARNSQLAWFGGSALFFITMIFPVQFDREWVTIGWALEGAALCWLFRRVPHAGLRLVGVGLLITSFVRLALNPAVLGYHERTGVAIFNWYLYAYGIVIVCFFAAARLLAPPRNLVLGRNVPPLLYSLGAVLAFILVNLQIADYFTPPGALVTTLEFSGNFARDMTYSIAWALFALMLVIIGIRQRQAAVRYAGLALLGVTLLKLFVHDLSQLAQLYRIGALMAVAVVAILASFLYQRFLAATQSARSPAEPPAG